MNEKYTKFIRENADMKVIGISREELKKVALDSDATILQLYRKIEYGYFDRDLKRMFEEIIDSN